MMLSGFRSRSALRGEKIGINYLEYVRQELIIPIAEEIRAEFGLPFYPYPANIYP